MPLIELQQRHSHVPRTGELLAEILHLPAGTRGALPQEPRRAIDQFLFEPALPIYLVDTPERYPRNKIKLKCQSGDEDQTDQAQKGSHFAPIAHQRLVSLVSSVSSRVNLKRDTTTIWSALRRMASLNCKKGPVP